MNRRRLAILGVLAATGVGIALARTFTPEYYEAAIEEGHYYLSDVPDPVLVGVVSVLVVVMWVAAMIVLARGLYWCWRQIDDYVVRLWNLLLPESPLIRFGAGVMLMIGLFVLGPMLVLQALEITSDDPIDEEVNESNDGNETATEDDEPENQTHLAVPTPTDAHAGIPPPAQS